MSVCYVRLSTSMSVCLYILIRMIFLTASYLSICLSVYFSVYVCLKNLFVYIICLSVYLSISIRLFIYLSIYQSIYPSGLSIYNYTKIFQFPHSHGGIRPWEIFVDFIKPIDVTCYSIYWLFPISTFAF